MNIKNYSCIILLLFSINGCVQENTPNILFIIGDDISRTSMGVYGSTYIKTPNFDRIANEGVLFTNAYVTNPKCAPARAGLLTGRYSWQLEEAANHWPAMPEKWEFYPDLLEKSGYFIGYTGKGWAPGTFPGEHNPAGWEYNNIELTPPFKGISPKDYAGNFEDFLNKNTQGKPFCFWLGTREAHRIFEKDVYKKNNIDLKDITVQKCFPDNELVRCDLADYGVEVEYHDMHIGRSLEILEERGLLDNTLIIATSDHGMAFPRIKGQIYDEGFHVAFVARWGNKIKAGRVVDDFINFPDVAPTLMEAAGLEPHEQMTGKSFLKQLLSEKSGMIDPDRNYALLGKERHDLGRTEGEQHTVGYPVRAIRTERYLYACNYKPDRWPTGDPQFGYMNCDKSPTKEYLLGLNEDDDEYSYFLMSFGRRMPEELYDVLEDPDCVNNLASHPEYSEMKNELKSKMEKKLREQKDPRMMGNGDIFDDYPLANQKKQKALYKDAYYDMQERFNEKYGTKPE